MVTVNRDRQNSATASHGVDVTELSPDYSSRFFEWQQIRDAMSGERRVRKQGTLYLPKPHGMTPSNYENYVNRASFFPVVDRTVRGVVGLVFRNAPVVDLPGQLQDRVDNATPEGFTMGQVMREAVRDVMSLGRYGLFVDLAPLNQSAANAAPYLATYQAEDIYNWEEIYDVRRAERVVSQIFLREEPTRAHDREMQLVRQLFLDPVLVGEGDDAVIVPVYRQQLWHRVESDRDMRTIVRGQDLRDEVVIFTGNFEPIGGPITPLMNGQPLDRIPFWFINPYDMRARTDKPPMQDLASTNYGHYRNSADYEHALFLVASPTPYVFGVKKEHVPKGIGPGATWTGPNSDVKIGMLEFTGQGIGAIEQAMKDKEARMSTLGARLLLPDPNRQVAAETMRLESREEMSIVHSVVVTVEEAFRRALRFMAEWGLQNSADVVVEINKDFVEVRLDPMEIQALVAMWQQDVISRDTLHMQLQRGEIMDPRRTLEAELKLIITERGSTPVGEAGDRLRLAMEAAGMQPDQIEAVLGGGAPPPPEPPTPEDTNG